MSTAVALASARVRVPSGMASASVLPTRAAATPPPRASTTTPIACRASPAVARVARLRAAASSAPSRGALAAARASTSERDETALTEAETTEMRLGRAAMLGFFFTTVGDVVTRGEGPLEQLVDEEMFIVNHVNPYELAKDALEVAGFYVESVFVLWVTLGLVFLAAVQQGNALGKPVRTYSSANAKAAKNGAKRVDAITAGVKEAITDVVREQRPYEVFNGRLAMLGITFAIAGDKVTGGMGPLEQLRGETGVPVIEVELFAAFFLFGVFFNVVATGVTVGKRAWQSGKKVM